ncbi:phosphoribosyltransferase family protein [Ornithinimicrobium sediminis]|uniref:phosphoribosyltransferase family protein n=1 Tax=Ornithinimicrobium sediminis TaxID=2904603 RepID=UPI001E329B07|nr:phosphoribosyltransferase family protein [Ornithinimicrobium sediminis]MCE0487243.1 dienelactone hydrolase family protein [Ornithinimicrobium sediminis]
MSFSDRVDAGRRLAALLGHLVQEQVVVLGLPRGGVPVAFEVAQALGAPLDVIVVRKLGVPYQPELGMGAIGEGGARVVNERIVRLAQVSESALAEVEARERAELERRARRFRGERPRLSLHGRTAVIVDDGIATGSTARAACQVARAQGAQRVVLAVPVAPLGWTSRFADEADELVAVETPDPFSAIGGSYDDFSQTSDEAVVECLGRAHRGPVASSRVDARDEELTVPAGPVALGGHLTIPEDATGVVVFAHGSGSSRHSPRNRFVAELLNQAHLGTVLFDLLTDDEGRDRANVFDIELLARRLVDVTRWLATQPGVAGLPLGYFGASTGAAAALWAATDPGVRIDAVVSRGGRPDLAAPRLGQVTAPTLLVVGGDDDVVLDLNRQAAALLAHCAHEVTVIPGATHLFEEPGTLQAAADAARQWFARHLVIVP